ncbi:Syntaxin-binding protein 5-like [Coemansia sp. RSA 552]|nr:Syntaxin-binding protein 5-like [Coemansia sp. RSA 552]
MPPFALAAGRSADPAARASAVAYDPVQGTMAVGHATGEITLLTSSRPASTRIGAKGPAVLHLQFVPGQPALAAIGGDGVLRVYDLDLDPTAPCFTYSIPLPPTYMSLFPGTSWLLVGTEAGRVYFVDAVNGRKSDFSLSCLLRGAPSPVAAVEPHPIETEKILVAYAEGTCVVCDIGKASVSERATVISQHRLDHPAASAEQPQTAVPWLLCAGWSPAGDRIVATYSNGVFAIFNAGTAAPALTHTIHDDPGISSPETGKMDSRALPVLRYVRWCTFDSQSQQQEFLVVTSGSTTAFQHRIHLYCTKGRGIVYCSSYRLDDPLTSLTTLPRASPWRNGNDRVDALAVVVGRRRPHVDILDILPDLSIQPTKCLPSELDWQRMDRVRVFCRARGQLNTAIGKILSTALGPGEQCNDTDGPGISQLTCCIEDPGILSLWCEVDDGRVQRCRGVGLDLVYLSRLVGIEGTPVAASLSALSGLLAVGMSTGEVLVCVLTSDCEAPIALNYTPLESVREQGMVYTSRDLPVDLPPIREENRPRSTQVDSEPLGQLPEAHRNRSASIHERALRLHVLPFMLTRLSPGCQVLDVVLNETGSIAVVTFRGGALVVVDSLGQRILLIDNINHTPSVDTTLSSILATRSSTDSAQVTAVAFAMDSDQQILLVGTSRGHIIQYSIGDDRLVQPPRTVTRASTGAILYISTSTDEPGKQTVVIGSTTTVLVYEDMAAKPALVHVLPDNDGTRIVAARLVRLETGWHGVAIVDSRARLTLLSPEDLSRVATLDLPPGSQALVSAAAAVQLGGDGHITVLAESTGHLLQTHILDTAGTDKTQPLFNASLQLPLQPTRKSITSWLLGKPTDPSQDLDKFFSSHYRDLLGREGRRPGARLRAAPTQPGMPPPRTRQDSKIGQIEESLDAAGPCAEAKAALEQREQQLEDVSAAAERMSIQSEGFLRKIRAYNAGQEKKKRHFGLF